MRHFTMRDNRTAKTARLKTEVIEEFTNAELKVTFLAEMDTHSSKHTEYNAPLWEGDIVEILLTLGDKNTYLEVEVNEFGTLYAVKIVNRGGEGDIEIEKLPQGYVTAEAVTEEQIWRTDVVISLDKIRELGYNENDVEMNYLRQNFRGEELELFSVSPTMCGSFHKTAAFFGRE